MRLEESAESGFEGEVVVGVAFDKKAETYFHVDRTVDEIRFVMELLMFANFQNL